MATHPQLALFATSLRDWLARRLAAEITSIESAEAKPTIYGCTVAPFTGLTGLTLIVSLNGSATTVTFTGDTIAAAVADINAAVTGVTASADAQADGSRIKLQGDTAAVSNTAQHLKITGGTGLDELGLVVGDSALEVAVPTITRRHVHAYDAEAAGLTLPVPYLFMGGRTGRPLTQGDEAIHDLGIELNIVHRMTPVAVAERQLDRIVRAISQLLQEDRRVDGSVLGCWPDQQIQVAFADADPLATGAVARVMLTAIFGEDR